MKPVFAEQVVCRAILTQEGGGFVSLDPQTGTASQGETESEALTNLVEAVDLFLKEFPSGQGKHG